MFTSAIPIGRTQTLPVTIYKYKQTIFKLQLTVTNTILKYTILKETMHYATFKYWHALSWYALCSVNMTGLRIKPCGTPNFFSQIKMYKMSVQDVSSCLTCIVMLLTHQSHWVREFSSSSLITNSFWPGDFELLTPKQSRFTKLHCSACTRPSSCVKLKNKPCQRCQILTRLAASTLPCYCL